MLKISLLALFLGSVVEDPTMVVLSLFGCFLLPVAGILSWFNARKLSYKCIFPFETFAHAEFDVGVTLMNDGRFLDRYSLCVEDRLLGVANNIVLPWVRAGQNFKTTRTTRIPNRGIYTEGKVALSSSFPMGLWQVEWRFYQKINTTVYPAPLMPNELRGMLGEESPNADANATSLPASNGEFRSLREFRHGDALKTVDWKSTARQQRMMMREFDPFVEEDYSVIFHSYRPEGDIITAREFERCMQLLCGFFLYCDNHQLRFDFTASFNRWQTIQVKSEDDLHQALVSLAGARQRVERKPERLLERIDRIPAENRLIVISNTPLHHWERLMQNLPVEAICLDGETWRKYKAAVPMEHRR